MEVKGEEREKTHQTPRRRPPQNPHRLIHLYRKRAPIPIQLIPRPYTAKNAVDDAEGRERGRDEGTGLGEDREEGGEAEES